MNNSCDIQTNAFEKLVSSSLNALSLSTGDFYFSNITIRHKNSLKLVRTNSNC